MLAKGQLVLVDDSTPKLPRGDPPTDNYRMQRVSRANEAGWNSAQLPTTERPPSQFAATKRGVNATSISVAAMPAPAPAPASASAPVAHAALTPPKGLPNIKPAQPGQSNVGVGGVPVKGQLFPPVKEDGASSVAPKISASNKFKAQKKQKGRPMISAPVLPQDGSSALARVPTIDLETAARNDKQRREMHPRPLESNSHKLPKASASEPSQSQWQSEALSPTTMVNQQRTKSIPMRKAVEQPEATHEPKAQLEPIVERSAFSMTSSAQLSPGTEDLRRRSPRQSQNPVNDDRSLQPAPLKTPTTYGKRAASSNTSYGAREARPLPQIDSVVVRSPPTVPIEPPPKSPLHNRTSAVPIEPPLKSPLRNLAPVSPTAVVSEEPSNKSSETEKPSGKAPEKTIAKVSKDPSDEDFEKIFKDPFAQSSEETTLKPVERLPAISSVRPSMSSVRLSARPPVRPVRRPPVASFVEPSDKVIDKPCETTPQERPMTLTRTPSAKGLGAMTQSSRPNGAARHRRSRSRSNSRTHKKDVMFTDPNAPPPIPEQCSAKPATTAAAEPPVTPPHNTADKPEAAVGSAEKKELGVTKHASPLQDKLSPSRPEGRLSLFPPNSNSKGTLGSPGWTNTMRGTSPMAARSIALAGILTPSQMQAFEAAHTPKGLPASSGLALRNNNAGSIHTRSISVPVDKPLPKSPGLVARVRESVLNRPRPIPRTPETAQVLQSHTRSQMQVHRGHRRSISLDTIKTKGSIVHATPLGSPSNLPPLPPIPQVSESTSREFLNNTKSMTFEEKMDILYAENSIDSRPSTSYSMRRRSSSMPDLSQFPVPAEMPHELENRPRPDSEAKPDTLPDRSTMTSVRTQSILELREFEGFKHALNAMSNALPAAGQEDDQDFHLRQESPSTIQGHGHGMRGGSQDSSLDDPALWDIDGFEDDATFTTGSMQSPGQELTIQQARSIHMAGPSPPQASESFAMVENVAPGGQMSSQYDDTGNSLAKATQQSGYKLFHHQVGDRCPGFTTRGGTIRSRRGPPPAPLRLNPPVKTMIVQAEPSPMSSPDEVLKMDQKLQRLERSSHISSEDRDQRMTLLADLEKEMGAQEDQWRQMRHTIIRDSLSTINVSPSEDVGQVAALWAKARESRGSQLFAAGHSKLQDPNANAGVDNASSRNSLNRLSVPGSRMSYLAVSHATTSYQGSPTPPDTDELEAEVDDELALAYMQSMQLAQQSNSPKLWRWEAPSPTITKIAPSLWSPSFGPSSNALEQSETTQPGPRANGGKQLENLEIQSSQLWARAVASPPKVLPTGLWGMSPLTAVAVATDVLSEPEPDFQTKPKPLALKPSRKIWRNTALPDILESPQPLPEKRDTLGIFQFAWGERSATGVIQPPYSNPSAMPGTMTSGSAMINPVFAARNVAQGGQPSFFVDNEEEDMGDNFSDSESGDGGDEFDETTIWEIASLLRGNPSPGEPSLRLTPSQWMGSSERTSVIASPTDYADSPHVGVSPVAFEDDAIMPVPTRASLLWKKKSLMFQSTKHHGLRQPDSKTWHSYVQAASSSSRPPRRRADHPVISSQELWSAPSPPVEVLSHNLLWSPDIIASSMGDSTTAPAQGEGVPKLWATPLHPEHRPTTDGMWAYQHQQALVSPAHKIAGLEMRPLARKQADDLPGLRSENLWRPISTVLSSPNWLVGSAHDEPNVSATQLWAAPASPEYRSTTDGMWSQQPLETPKSPAHKIAGLDIRPMTRKQPDGLPGLSSANLWRPVSAVLASPNWLVAADGHISTAWAARRSVSGGGLTRPKATAADWEVALADATQASQKVGSRGARHEDNNDDVGDLWSMRPAQALSPETERMWRPSPNNGPSEPSSSVRAPRYDRRTVALDSRTSASLPSHQDQAMWSKNPVNQSRPVSQKNWMDLTRTKSEAAAKRKETMDKAEKKRTFVGDVQMVQQYLERRWGGV